MARPPRAEEKDGIYHVLNRANSRRLLFQKEADYEAFERVLLEGLERIPVRVYAYQWMPTHWHMLLSPYRSGDLSQLLQWVTMTHARRYHAHYDTVGQGHIYQGRFKSFPVQDDPHYYVLGRYVERNARTAGLVRRAEWWRWGSLWRWLHPEAAGVPLSEWPIPRPSDWIERVNEPLSAAELRKVRRSVIRSAPFGDSCWVETAAHRHQLQSTLRPQGRPRKFH